MCESDKRPTKVSVIIPTYNDYDDLEFCLEALQKQTFPEQEFEVIVVDNGSDPDNHRNVSTNWSNVSQYEQSHPGSYAARNLGIARSEGDVLAFTDADCRPSPDWLERGVEAIREHSNAGLVGGDIEVFAKEPEQMTAVEKFQVFYGFNPEYAIEERNFMMTANLFTTRSVVESVGTFDGSLMSGGDRQWGQRIARSGYELVFEPEIVVRHPARRTLDELLKRINRVARGWHRDDSTGYAAADTMMTLQKFLIHLSRAGNVTRETQEVPELGLIDKCQILGIGYLQGLVEYSIRLKLSLMGDDK